MFGDTALRYLTISASQPSWMGRYVCVCFMVLASACNYCCAQMFNAISHACTVCIMWEQPFIKLHSIRPYKAKARMQCFFFYANALLSLSLSRSSVFMVVSLPPSLLLTRYVQSIGSRRSLMMVPCVTYSGQTLKV